LFTDGHVACSGLGSGGRLGDGTQTDASVPVTVPGLMAVQQVAAGASFTCALLGDQTVSCWGFNAAGDVCSGGHDIQATPASVAGVSSAVKIAAGSAHACALLANGTVTCWGSNDHGQLGAPSASGCANAHGPIVIPSLNDVVDVSAGDGHTCALLANGTAVCWGYNKYGQLGDGTTADRGAPQAVPGLSGIVQLVAGYMDTCAIVGDGALECWGAVNPYFSSVIHLAPSPVTF
jgi:alpha-tubulin suppressor-like RCC1 family protein